MIIFLQFLTIEEQKLENLKDISAADVLKKKAKKYDAVIPVIKDLDGKALKKGTDFIIVGYAKVEKAEGDEVTLTPVEGTPNVGDTIRVTVKGNGNYSSDSEAHADFRIIEDDKTISKATVTVEPQTYTGNEITLSGKDQVTVAMKVNGTSVPLKEGTDYEILENGYTKNINKGTAKMTIHGIGDYGGTKNASFKIVAHDLTSGVEWYSNLYNRAMSWFHDNFNK